MAPICYTIPAIRQHYHKRPGKENPMGYPYEHSLRLCFLTQRCVNGARVQVVQFLFRTEEMNNVIVFWDQMPIYIRHQPCLKMAGMGLTSIRNVHTEAKSNKRERIFNPGSFAALHDAVALDEQHGRVLPT